MSSREDWNVDGDARRVGLVQPDAEVPLSAEQQQDEDPDVHQPHPALVGPRVVEVVQDRHHDVQHIAGLQHEEEELLVVFAKLPEKYQQLLEKEKSITCAALLAFSSNS